MTVIKKIIAANIVGASFLVTGMAHAQTGTYAIERQVIGSCGTSMVNLSLPEANNTGSKLYDIEWTVGEMAVKTYTYPDYMVLTQGFQQPRMEGIENQMNLDDMYLYPNPTGGVVNIRYTLDSNVTRVDIRVLSLAGRLMYTESVAPITEFEFSHSLDCSKYVPGIYLISLIMDTGIKVTKKLVKLDIQ
jgi:hypothetical protein